MARRELENVRPLVDEAAKGRGDPGLSNTYIASLAGSLGQLGERPDPAWLMGTSGFAFRIIVHEAMCPSATSVFNWSGLLVEAVEQAGRHCEYHCRYWHQDNLEERRRLRAHEAILRAVDRGVPPIVWDIHVPEWGLISGYDTGQEVYITAGCDGRTSTMPFDRLGLREVKILSVAIPGEPNGRPREEIVRRSLEAAVRHAEGDEWTERPKYEDGPAAWDRWADLIDPATNRETAFEFASYYAASWVGARCYARDYLAALAREDEGLAPAAATYERLAAVLLPVWERFREDGKPGDAVLCDAAARLREARRIEEEGIDRLRDRLGMS